MEGMWSLLVVLSWCFPIPNSAMGSFIYYISIEEWGECSDWCVHGTLGERLGELIVHWEMALIHMIKHHFHEYSGWKSL